MMNVTIEDAGACRKLMRVHAPPEAVKDDYEKVVDAYALQARLPGFRKGKAPRSVVEKRFASDIAENVRERLVPRLYRDALKQEGVSPVAIVKVNDVEFVIEKGLDFNVTLDVAPEFKLPRYKKISLKQNKVTLEEKRVEETITRIRESHARYEDVESRPVKDGDLVRIDYTGMSDGKPLSEVAPDNAVVSDGTDFLVLVGGVEVIPGLSRGLEGVTIGEKRDIETTFPEDYRTESLRGRSAVFSVEVKGIKERILPEFDEALFKQLEVDSEDALRERVRKELLAAEERGEQSRLREEVSRFLLDKTTFDLPQSVVDQEIQLTVRSMLQRIMSQGASREQVAQQQESIMSAATETSKDRVKLSYILSRIAEEEGITVEDAEVDRRVQEMSGYYRMPPEKMRAELEKRDGVENLRSDIRSEKTIDFLMENAKIKK